MSAATATPKTWRVVINPKLWDLDRFMMEWKPGTLIHQSKGAFPMVNDPARGDIVVYVTSSAIVMPGKGRYRAIVMRGTVVSDGFLEGTAHQEDPYIRDTTSGTRPHTETPLYADIQIDDVYLDIAAPPPGPPTWALVSDKDRWRPTLRIILWSLVSRRTRLSAEVADLRIRLAAAEARHAETNANIARLHAAFSSFL